MPVSSLTNLTTAAPIGQAYTTATYDFGFELAESASFISLFDHEYLWQGSIDYPAGSFVWFITSHLIFGSLGGVSKFQVYDATAAAVLIGPLSFADRSTKLPGHFHRNGKAIADMPSGDARLQIQYATANPGRFYTLGCGLSWNKVG